jgi:hypothetical protein
VLEEPVNHSMTSGMPAANQGPPVSVALRIRSTGLPQGFEGAGERVSSIVKSPSAASATALATGVLWTVNGPLGSVPQISVAKTLCPPFVPIALPPARSRPRPSTWIRPSTFTSALRARISSNIYLAEAIGFLPNVVISIENSPITKLRPLTDCTQISMRAP